MVRLGCVAKLLVLFCVVDAKAWRNRMGSCAPAFGKRGVPFCGFFLMLVVLLIC